MEHVQQLFHKLKGTEYNLIGERERTRARIPRNPERNDR